MKAGDLVKLVGIKDDSLGLVIYKHPTKGVAQIFWSDIGFNWESTSRLSIVSQFGYELKVKGPRDIND